ncbi:hypothetical protein GF366_04430, partial [Candidatus Peregrinibacteria bacterium]|nr:hypothetical protein [Candidatus Peregrinibacteria bacterium]
ESRSHQTITSQTHDDTVETLLKLGYNRKEIRVMLKSLPEELIEVEQIITYILKNK